MVEKEKRGAIDAPKQEDNLNGTIDQVEFIDIADLTPRPADAADGQAPENDLLTPPPPSDNARAPDYYNTPKKRGRKRMTEEEKEQRRYEREERRKMEAAKADDKAASKLTAATVVGGLDSIRDLISLNECAPNPELRAATLAAWERYCYETGKDIPASAMVIITSSIYVAPAFHTTPAIGLFKSLGRKIKGLWVKYRG